MAEYVLKVPATFGDKRYGIGDVVSLSDKAGEWFAQHGWVERPDNPAEEPAAAETPRAGDSEPQEDDEPPEDADAAQADAEPQEQPKRSPKGGKAKA